MASRGNLHMILAVALATTATYGAACGGGGPKPAAAPVAARPPTRVPIEQLEEEEDSGGADEVQVEGLKGHLDRMDIQPVVEGSWPRVQECYSGGIGKLRYVGGQVELKFRVARDGSVKHVHIARGTLGSWPVEKCVLDLAKAMHFPRPKGGEAEFSFPIEFPPRGRVIAMDERRAASELPAKLAQLTKCHDASDGPMPGQIDVTIYVGPGGAVTSVGFAADSNQPIPETWADCAEAVATTWKLTDPRGTVLKATATWESR